MYITSSPQTGNAPLVISRGQSIGKAVLNYLSRIGANIYYVAASEKHEPIKRVLPN